MDKTTIPHAGGLAASTCRGERRRTPAKPTESALSFLSIGVQPPAGQVGEPLPRRIDPVVH